MDDPTSAHVAGSHFEDGAGDVLDRIRALEPEEQGWKEAFPRNAFLAATSAIVLGIVLTLVVQRGDVLFTVAQDTASTPPPTLPPTPPSGWSYLIPFGTAFAGVLLFIMSVARDKRSKFDFRKYFGEYAYRVAQTAVYLLIVWWAWTVWVARGNASTSLPPNILGLLVGLFILRVERSIEAMGEKFEEVLSTILPGAISLSGPEKRQVHLKAASDVRDLETQWQLLRSRIPDLGARDKIDAALEAARKVTGGRDSGKARTAATELFRLFDDVKESADGERWVSLESLL